jgi:hypothetical protein
MFLMLFLTTVSLTLLLSNLRAECVAISDARKHVGETRCVTGKVFRIEQGDRGVRYLDFCEDYRTCPFTVVVFPRDLKNVGDIRELQGRVIEIHGPVKEYDGRAEVILQEPRQLRGAGSRIPPLPRNYDVEHKGHYSAGKMSHPKSRKTSNQKKHPATVPIQVPEDTDD